MGSEFSRCLGLQSYMQVHEDYVSHPGQTHSPDPDTVVAFTSDEDSGQNPESIFYEGTEV